jgi:hypothetical protein
VRTVVTPFESALDAGTIQDAIEDARETMGADFTIESTTITQEFEVNRREES